MSKRFICLVIALSLLTGCAGSNSEIKRLNNLDSVNSGQEDEVDTNLSYTEEQDLVYAQVSDRKLLDLDSLVRPDNDLLEMVVTYMDEIDKQLIGEINDEKKYAMDECFSNYLLALFETTPRYWQRTKTIVRGMDSESKNIIVDVVYKTIPYKKDVKGDSFIVLGEPEYTRKMKNRYERYMTLLDNEMKENESDDYMNRSKFEDLYGKIDEIYDSQENESLTQEIARKHNQTTYTGLVDTNNKKSGGEMTIRYVLAPKIVLGLSEDVFCQHMYLLNYKISKDPTKGLNVITEGDYDTIADNVYSLIYSYFTCIDESDFNGLYKLTSNFKTLDKYYNDMFNTTYNKHDSFVLSIFNVLGTHVDCGITISSKARPKGSSITYPLYTDKYYAEIDLEDDILKITELDLLSREIQGEPDIKTTDVQDMIFDSKISLSKEDRMEIQDLIVGISMLQVNEGDYTTTEQFEELVDISIDTDDLQRVKNNLLSITGTDKVVWFNGFRQGNDGYASANCTENFKKTDGSIVATDTDYKFIKKGGKWKIMGYNITGSYKIKTSFSSEGSLCYVKRGESEPVFKNYKIAGSTKQKKKGDTSEISVVYEHDEYTPGDILDEEDEEDNEKDDEDKDDKDDKDNDD